METEEFTSGQLEVEYLHDVDDVGSENLRQKKNAELGRSLNHADKENKKNHLSKGIASVSHSHFSANTRENDGFPAASLSS